LLAALPIILCRLHRGAPIPVAQFDRIRAELADVPCKQDHPRIFPSSAHSIYFIFAALSAPAISIDTLDVALRPEREESSK
jgi:hypothetical protein